MEKSGVILEKGEQAHHIIPKQALKDSETIEDAVTAGFDLHGAFNSIGLKALKDGGEHGKHPKYTIQIVEYMDKWAKQAKKDGNYSPEAAKKKLESVTEKIRDQIEKEVKGKGPDNRVNFMEIKL